jgi:hypothetical protein
VTWRSTVLLAAYFGIAGIALGFADRAEADPKKHPDAKPAASPTAGGLQGDKPTGKPGDKKEKTYNFGGLDIDGKLKTPQLLYFLNRMKSEFDTTTPDKRSFIPELKRSTEEM